MRMSLTLWIMLVGLVFCHAASAQQQATTQEACDTIPLTKTNWVAGVTPGVDSMTIPLFDPSLGCLQGVEIRIQACVDQVAVFKNTADEPVDPNNPDTAAAIDIGAYVETTLLDGAKLRATASEHAEPFVDVGGSVTITQDNHCEDNSAVVTDPAKLGPYIASGGVTSKTLPTRSSVFVRLDGSGNLNYTITTFAGADVCIIYTYLSCNDSNACTTDVCVDDQCIYTPVVCNDNNACTTDACVDGECVYTPVVCNDEDACTTDACVNGECVYTPVVCNDEDACTTDACVDGQCVYTPIVCNDGNACTTDACVDGECVYTGVVCDDGDECTTEDCVNGVCIYTDIVCADDNACTTDACDPVTGCTYEAVDCDDGDECTADSCDPATGCINTPIPGCECDCSAYAPDICLPIICVQKSSGMYCKDYSLPAYSAELKCKLTAAKGGCTGDCSEFSVVLPANINWNTPGVYEYTVVCGDATGECSSTDTGRLTVDWNCGCGTCGCSRLC